MAWLPGLRWVPWSPITCFGLILTLVFATHGRVVFGVDTPWQWVQDGPDRYLLDDGSLGSLPEKFVPERQLRGYCIPEGKWLDLRLIRPQ